MQSDRFVKMSLIVVIVLLVGVIALHPVLFPGEAHAQRTYKYEFVPIHPGNAREVLAERTKDGWEPITFSFHNENGANGFLLLRK